MTYEETMPDAIRALIPQREHPDFVITSALVNNARSLWNGVHTVARKERGRAKRPDVEGFTFLAAGLHRRVYRRGDYVYKYSGVGYGEYINASEHFFLTRQRIDGNKWWAPPTALIGKTLVMPYYDIDWSLSWNFYGYGKEERQLEYDKLSDPAKIMYHTAKLVEECGYTDAHSRNIGMDKKSGLPVLMDAGGFQHTT